MSKPIVYNVAKAERQIAELKKSIEELKIGEMGYLEKIGELKAERNELKKRMEKMKYDLDFINSDRNLLKEENEKLIAEKNELKAKHEKLFSEFVAKASECLKLKAKIEESVECGADCDECKNKCRAWQNGYNYNRPQSEIIGTKALIESYIDRLQNCGLGKKKSLEYVGKFISCLIFEKAEEEKAKNTDKIMRALARLK